MNKRTEKIKGPRYTRIYPDAPTILQNALLQNKNTKTTIKKFSLNKIFLCLLLTVSIIGIFSLILKPKKIEHVTNISKPKLAALRSQKITKPVQAKNSEQNLILMPRAGDSMSNIFKRVGLGSEVLLGLLKNKAYAKYLTNIKPSQKINFIIKNNVLQELIIPISIAQTLDIRLTNKHYDFHLINAKTETRTLYLSQVITGSIYNTAKKAKIPASLIAQLVEMLSHDFNVSRNAKTGDIFTILYKADYIKGQRINAGKILALSYKNQDNIYKVLLYKSSQGGEEYYNDKGNNFKKAFIRYPVKFSHISSPFSLSRMHPILHYRRPHKGVDLAAPLGTPVHATADGVITEITRQNGYGNMIKIAHFKIYHTIYAHLLKFERGLSRGSRVHKGQVIGYVGQSGLADGPHCHYELHIYNQARNPSTTALPIATPLSAKELRLFKTKSKQIFDKLKLFEEATLKIKKNL